MFTLGSPWARPTFMLDPDPAPPAPPAPPVDPPAFVPPADQASFDRIIGERVARERAKYADYEDLKAKAAKFDEHEASNQTELEKLARERAEAVTRAESAEAELRSARVMSALISEAAKAGARNPHLVATQLASSDAVTIDNAGVVTGAETAVNTLKTSDGYLFEVTSSTVPPSTNFGGGQGRGGAGQPEVGSTAKGAELWNSRHKKSGT